MSIMGRHSLTCTDTRTAVDGNLQRRRLATVHKRERNLIHLVRNQVALVKGLDVNPWTFRPYLEDCFGGAGVGGDGTRLIGLRFRLRLLTLGFPGNSKSR